MLHCLFSGSRKTGGPDSIRLHRLSLECLQTQMETGAFNFPEKLPTVSEAEAKLFVMLISSKQFQFVRSSSRLDVMMGPLRWVIRVQTTTTKGKIGGNNSNFVSADISPGAFG